MQPSNDEIQTRLMYEVALYREQLNMLQKEMERINLTTIDLNNSLRTVEKLEKKDTLIPVGGGTFVKAAVSDTKVVVPVGAQYFCEMEREEAVVELNRRKDATKKAIERLEEEFKKIAAKFREVSMQLKEMETRVKLSQRVEEGVKEDYI